MSPGLSQVLAWLVQAEQLLEALLGALDAEAASPSAGLGCVGYRLQPGLAAEELHCAQTAPAAQAGCVFAAVWVRC